MERKNTKRGEYFRRSLGIRGRDDHEWYHGSVVDRLKTAREIAGVAAAVYAFEKPQVETRIMPWRLRGLWEASSNSIILNQRVLKANDPEDCLQVILECSLHACSHYGGGADPEVQEQLAECGRVQISPADLALGRELPPHASYLYHPFEPHVLKFIETRYSSFVQAGYADRAGVEQIEERGLPPRVFYVTEYAPSTSPSTYFNDRETLGQYILDRHGLRPVSEPVQSWKEFHAQHFGLSEEEMRPPKMFRPYGFVDYAFNPNTGWLEDTFAVGSTYGRGYRVNVAVGSDGHVEVLTSDMAWIS